jgi:hypothetical protein
MDHGLNRLLQGLMRRSVIGFFLFRVWLPSFVRLSATGADIPSWFARC